MSRPIELIIHPEALRHNLAQGRRRAPDAKIFAVVKADAYGHGLQAVLAGLGDADGFALLEVREAEVLRHAGWRGPILLIEGCFDARELEACSRLQLWHVIHCQEQIEQLATLKTDHPHRVFLKMNSGMNRLGMTPDAFRNAFVRLNALPQVGEVSLMTHFANGDRAPDGDTSFLGIAQQCAVFERACLDLDGERTLANSSTTLRFGVGGPQADHALHDQVLGDWVRLGIMLYGGSPDHPEHTAQDWQLLPAMTLRSHLIAVQEVEAGGTVGYGSTFRVPQATRIGVVACGYADGYPRHAPNGTPVLVDGVRTRVVGRVSMDAITVDLTPVPAANIGSEVTLWGQGPSDSRLLVDEVAHAAGTIGYELMCAVAPRVPRRTA